MAHVDRIRGIESSAEQEPAPQVDPTWQSGPERPGRRSDTRAPDGTARRLAWTRTYLDAGDLDLAVVCFRRAMASVSPGDARRHRDESMQVAEHLTRALLVAERTDTANDVLWLLSAWGHGTSTAESRVGSESTVIASNPLLAGVPTPLTEHCTPLVYIDVSDALDEPDPLTIPLPQPIEAA